MSPGLRRKRIRRKNPVQRLPQLESSPNIDSASPMMVASPEQTMQAVQRREFNPQTYMAVQGIVGQKRAQNYIARSKEKNEQPSRPDNKLIYAMNGLVVMLEKRRVHAPIVVMQYVPEQYKASFNLAADALRTHYDNAVEPPSGSGLVLKEKAVGSQPSIFDRYPDATKAISERYMGGGMQAMFTAMQNADQLVIREQIKYEQKAIGAWQAAYPQLLAVLNDYEAQHGVIHNGKSVDSIRSNLADMTTDMVSELPRLMAQVQPLPPEAEMYEAFFMARQMAEYLQGFVDNIKAYQDKATSGGDEEKAKQEGGRDLTGEEIKAQMNPGLEALKEVPKAKGKIDAFRDKGFTDGDITEMKQGLPSKDHAQIDALKPDTSLEDNAMRALGVLNMIVASPDDWAKAMKEYDKDKLAGTFQAALVIKDLTEKVVLPVTNWGVSAVEYTGVAIGWSKNNVALIEQVQAATGKIKSITKGIGGVLGNVGATLDFLSAIHTFSSGLATNDFEKIAGGALSLTQASISTMSSMGIISASTAPLAPIFVLTQALVSVLSEATKMYGAMHVGAMKEAMFDLPYRARFAVEDGRALVMATQQGAQLAEVAQSDPVMAALYQQYQQQAMVAIKALPRNLIKIVDMFYEGTLSQYPILVQGFQNGIADDIGLLLDDLLTLENTAYDLADNRTEWDIEEMGQLGEQFHTHINSISTGLNNANQAIGGYSEDVKTAHFLQPDQQEDMVTIHTTAYTTHYNTVNFAWHNMYGRSPIYQEEYQQSIAERVNGKSVDSIYYLPLSFEITVGGGKLIMNVTDGELVDYDTSHPFIDSNLLKLHQKLGAEEPSVDGAVEVIWDSLQNKTINGKVIAKPAGVK